MRSLADVAAGQYYRHYKGGYYFVLAVADDAENISSPVIVYAAIGKNGQNWFLTAEEFLKELPGGMERFSLCTLKRIAASNRVELDECPRHAEAKL